MSEAHFGADLQDTAHQREAQQRRPGIKAILVTGFATEAIAGAAVTVLHKPVSGAELSRQVAALLRSEPVAG